jgi:hypothetical protein
MIKLKLDLKVKKRMILIVWMIKKIRKKKIDFIYKFNILWYDIIIY